MLSHSKKSLNKRKGLNDNPFLFEIQNKCAIIGLMEEIHMQKLRENSTFLPLSLIAIFTLLMIFDRIGLNSTEGYIYQLVLALFALTYITGHGKKPRHVVSIMLGFLFCFIGDLFLAGAFKDFIDSGLRMPLGMAGFFLGHIWWFISLLQYKEKYELKRTLIVFVVVYVLIFIVWLLLVNNPDNSFLSILALLYSWGIAAPFALSVSMVKTVKPYAYLIIGYANLIFSDTLIAVRDIKGLDPFGGWHDDIVWWTYLVGISAITYFFVIYKKAFDSDMQIKS